MKKKNFVSLILGTIGGMLFSLGMCMCLVEEWNAFRQGIVAGVIGAAVLLVMLIVRRKMSGKPAIKLGRKAIGAIVLGIAGTLILGTGMCMVMVWNMMLWGIAVGSAGILLLVMIIPVIKGIE